MLKTFKIENIQYYDSIFKLKIFNISLKMRIFNITQCDTKREITDFFWNWIEIAWNFNTHGIYVEYAWNFNELGPLFM